MSGEHEHQPGSEPDCYRCSVCGRVRLTVQIFRNGEPMGERIAWIHAPDETRAADAFLRLVRIDFRYRFLGLNGFILPSNPDDYLIYKG